MMKVEIELSELNALRKECDALQKNLTRTQNRCTDVIEENRDLERRVNELHHSMTSIRTMRAWALLCWRSAEEHGFHDEGVNDSCPAWVANLHGEVSELWEAYRKGSLNEPCDKPAPLTNAEEELADIVIRVFDTAVQLDIDIENAVEIKYSYNLTRPFRHGGKQS